MCTSTMNTRDLAEGSCSSACINCTFRHLSLFSKLQQEELQLLNSNKSFAHYQAGKYIFKEGGKIKGLLCLQQGKVKLTRRADSGNNVIIALNKPVEFIALPELLIHQHHHSSAMALEDTFICTIDSNHFMEIMQNNAAFSLQVSTYLSGKLESAQNHLMHLTQKHMRGRLAYAILYFKDFFGIDPINSFLNMGLKRSDLAEWTNMTTANVIRTLSSFSVERLIEVRGRNIKILDEASLKQIYQLN